VLGRRTVQDREKLELLVASVFSNDRRRMGSAKNIAWRPARQGLLHALNDILIAIAFDQGQLPHLRRG